MCPSWTLMLDYPSWLTFGAFGPAWEKILMSLSSFLGDTLSKPWNPDHLSVSCLSIFYLSTYPSTYVSSISALLWCSWPRKEKKVLCGFSRGSSQPRDQTWVSCIAGRFFTSEAPPGKPTLWLYFHKQNKTEAHSMCFAHSRYSLHTF